MVINMIFDDLYDIRIARKGDIEKVMKFIEYEWKTNHILAINRDFFEYEHLVGDRINFIIAVNKQTQKIDAVQGFIQYRKDLKDSDVFGVIWKTSNEVKIPFLGIEVIKRVLKLTGARNYWGIGSNPKTSLPLHRDLLKFNVGKLDHYYRIKDKEVYNIAVIGNKKILPVETTDYKMIECEEYSNIQDFIQNDYEKGDYRPQKDEWYINKRYFSHPRYRYKSWKVVRNNKIYLTIIGREILYNNTKILKIVDCLGKKEYLTYISSEMQRIIDEGNYEYVDFYQIGIPESIMKSAGFTKIIQDDVNIIPLYFSPYLPKNIDIFYGTNYKGADYTMFIGDGDQDRPNTL